MFNYTPVMTIPQPDLTVSSSDNRSGATMDRKVDKPSKRWWQDRRLLIAGSALVLLAIVWQTLPASGSTDVDSDDIQTGDVAQAVFEDYLPIRANVTPANTTLVGVLSGGQVEELMAQDGALVTKNQPLARLTNPDLELEVLSQEAAIASQLGGVAGETLGIQRSRLDRADQVSSAEYDLIRARRNLDIRVQLHDQGFVSEAGVKSYTEEVDYQSRRLAQLRQGRSSEADIIARQGAMLEAARFRLQSNLAAVRGSLDTLTIRAPMAGRLTNFTLQPGQTLSPGDSAGQVDSEGAWKLEADVDEYFLRRVRVGQKAQTEDGAAVVVSKVLPTVTNGRFRIELTFDDLPEKALNRGQAVDIRITLGSAKSAVVVPMGRWLAEGGSTLFVVDPDGSRAHRVTVEIGRRNPRQVEILSGVEPGQKVILSDLSQVKGDIINIR